jgi:hypothetical protein
MIDPRVVQTVTRAMPMEPPPLLRLSNQPGLAATTDRTRSSGLAGLHFPRLENLLITETPSHQRRRRPLSMFGIDRIKRWTR